MVYSVRFERRQTTFKQVQLMLEYGADTTLTNSAFKDWRDARKVWDIDIPSIFREASTPEQAIVLKKLMASNRPIKKAVEA